MLLLFTLQLLHVPLLACNNGRLKLLLGTAMALHTNSAAVQCSCCICMHAAPNLRVYAVSTAAGFQLLLLNCMAAATC